jgi:hypothetical protein
MSSSTTGLFLLLRALPACPHLRMVFIRTKYACADAVKNLLQMRPLNLLLNTDQCLAVAAGIRHGRCNIQRLTLAMDRRTISDATEVVKAIASAIQLDRSLEPLELKVIGFRDEAGVALAEALTVNKTPFKITLSTDARVLLNNITLGTPAYEAFCTMLRVNTSLRLDFPTFEATGADERLVDSRNQMRIEQRLNHVGRGRLISSSQTTRKEWVDSLHELSFNVVDDPSAFRVSCLYSVLRSNPTAVCMSLVTQYDSTTSSL